MKNQDEGPFAAEEDTSFVAPKPAKRRALTKTEPVVPIDPNAEMEESFYGQKYPKNDVDWISQAGIEKRIHCSEMAMFYRDYGLCIVKNVWRKKSLMVTNESGEFISKELTKGKDKKFGFCHYYKCFFPIDQIGKAWDASKNPMIEIDVSLKAIRRSFGTCSFDKKLIYCDYLVVVSESDKYDRVNINLVGLHFSKCLHCAKVYEIPNVFVRPELHVKPMCNNCYAKKIKINTIFKHDARNYPGFISTVSTNMGYEIRDGLVCATMQKSEKYLERLYGVEIESELDMNGCIRDNVNRIDVARSILDGVGRDFVMIKEDGTLIKNGKYSDEPGTNGPKYAGFEIVSAGAGLDVHRNKWGLLEATQHHNLLRSWDCDTCGMHIHVSRDALESDLVISRMLVFINEPKNRKFLWKVAGRSKSNFIYYSERKFCDAIHIHRIINPNADTDRRKARWVPLNLQNPETIEIRIFRGTVNARHIIRNVEFYDSLIEFCMPCARSLNEMKDFRNYVAFVDRNRKRWPLLAAWFAYHEIITLKKILRPEKANLNLLTLKMEDIPEKDLCAS
jgi:hypothetical protein